jgi:hypothetical protein
MMQYRAGFCRSCIERTLCFFSNPSFTLQPTTGYSQGRGEKSIVLEIVEARRKDVTALAKSIRKLNGQKSALIMRLIGKAEKID